MSEPGNDDEAAENVQRLPIRFKEQAPVERTVVRHWEIKRRVPCDHLGAAYLIAEGNADVECSKCGGRLDPMWVLGQIATHDRRYADNRGAYQAEQKRLSERKRTKCDSCGHMTRISRR